MCVCACAHTCVHLTICMFVYEHLCVCVSVSVCLWVYVCVFQCLCAYVCMCVFVCLCLSVSVCVSAYFVRALFNDETIYVPPFDLMVQRRNRCQYQTINSWPYTVKAIIIISYVFRSLLHSLVL